MVHVWHISEVDCAQKHNVLRLQRKDILHYRSVDFYDLLLWLLAMQGGVCAVRFADHLPSARPVYDPAKKCKDTVVSAWQFVTLFK